MTTKFDIGQGVWYMRDNRPRKDCVISIEIKGSVDIDEHYILKSEVCRSVFEIAETKKELMRLIFNF